jgi:hypothetical protein
MIADHMGRSGMVGKMRLAPEFWAMSSDDLYQDRQNLRLVLPFLAEVSHPRMVPSQIRNPIALSNR